MNGELYQTVLQIHTKYANNKGLCMVQLCGGNSAHAVPTEKEIHLARQHLMPKLIQRIQTAESAISVAKWIDCNRKWPQHYPQHVQIMANTSIPIHHPSNTCSLIYTSQQW
jgi:hypothetical protein